MTKRNLGQALLNAGIISVGIVSLGITFTGSEGLQNIENNMNGMKDKIEEVVVDSTFIQSQYKKLEGFYTASVTTANEQIAKLTNQRDGFFQELTTLKNDIANTPTAQEDADEIQSEITRLESELVKANEEIATLEATTQAIVDETIVERVEKADFTAQAVKVDSIPLLITPEAMALNAELATELSKLPDKLTFGNDGAGLRNLEYKTVTVIDGIFTFEVESVFVRTSGIMNVDSPQLEEFMHENSVDLFYITDGSGQNYRLVFEEGTRRNFVGYYPVK